MDNYRIGTENDDARAQVGIGTLIVFIAMVLVAAIAAGVLINTAGFLQTQAQDTGTESTSQVADNLNVITTAGNVSDASRVNILRLGVQPAAGAGDINLAKFTLQYVSDDEFANVVVGNDSTGQAAGDTTPENIGLTAQSIDDQAEFAIEVVTAENEDDVVMTDGADRYELIVPLNIGLTNVSYPVYNSTGDNVSDGSANIAGQGGLPPGLDEGDSAQITITTEVGAQTVTFIQVPDSLTGDDPGDTINV
ncbi:archaellin/type IV pilin N-terminal domain-containing protein [Halovenus salina]|uniref:Flagellin n=1 Tax=Halovenus salina TaxID=1510225 RepID=A0ABD5W3B0_9EURY|nr:archaellin/type IV pilin N-terminal domain-containing protein [Halovenus salina]